MSPSRTDELLEAWGAVAHAAELPTEAPRPPSHIARVTLAAAAAIVIVVVVAVVALGIGGQGGPTAGTAGSAPATTISATVSAAPTPTARPATPSPTATPSPLALPNPGGTCSASRIVVGQVTGFPGYPAIGSDDWFVRLALKNGGPDCVLHLPAVIGVASATGPFTAVTVNHWGTVTATGDNSTKQFATIRAGHTLSIVLGDSWYTSAPWTPPPCSNPVSDVARVVFPLAAGNLQIELPTEGGRAPFKRVCSSPASMTVSIDLSRPG